MEENNDKNENNEPKEAPKKEKKARRRFPKIAPSVFQHPMDTKALEAIKMAKGVDLLIRKLNEYGFERYLYINNIADNVEVTPRQCPSLHEKLVEACEILDVDLPQLYITQEPKVNAFTFGSEKPFIVVNSGMIDLLDDDELFTVIAHEVGHIKCGHVLYKMVARFLSIIFEIVGDLTPFGIGKLLAGPIMLAFYEWDRKSELSADRAGLLGIQDPDIVIRTLMKLAGGSQKIYEQFDKDEFLKQADKYQELDSSMLNQFYKFLQVVFRTHPFPALRAKEIKIWSESPEYRNIMNGIYTRIDMSAYAGGTSGSSYRGGPSPGWTPPYTYSPGPNSCPNCNATVDAGASFCHVCGSTIIGAIAVIDKPEGGAPKDTPPPNPPKQDGRPRCNSCGAELKPNDDYCPACGLNTRIDW